MQILKNNIEYSRFADKLYAGTTFTDAWIDGCERFSTDSLVLTGDEYERLCLAAEKLGYLFNEFVKIIIANPEFLDSYFNLTDYQKALFISSGGLWHGIARLDLFFLPDGSIRACEMNSDTPSGEPEAVSLNSMHEVPINCFNPNLNFEKMFCDAVFLFTRKELGLAEDANISIGIVFPTEIPEDLAMIELYRTWLENAGAVVELGSPFNLHLDEATNELYLFNTKIDLLFRHYKTDWWCERFSAWQDGFFQDEEPLTKELTAVFKAQDAGKICVFNPFGSVITQNKLAMSFFHENKELFSEKCVSIIDEYFPTTRKLANLQNEEIIKEHSVLKSDYGCEGDEVVIGKFTGDDIWAKSLELAVRDRWIVQDFFETIKIDDCEPNFGVYLIGGKAAGIYTRLSKQSTDYYSKSIATYIIK